MILTPQNVNEIARKLGGTLVNAGLKMIASAFHLSPHQITYDEMVNLLKTKLPNVEQGLMDSNYFLIDFATWKDIIATDWIETKKYLMDKFDCDNFAYTFAAHCSEIFDITVATCYGKVLNKNTGALVAYHYWNILITYESDGTKHLYFLEPANDCYVEVLGQKDIIINDWIYVPIKAIVF